jgi:hypothetical protein
MACLVLLAHQITPHDHHSDSPVTAHADECPSHQHESDHPHSVPIHCHALNDLAFDKLMPVLTFSTHLPVLNLLIFEVSDPIAIVTIINPKGFIKEKEPLPIPEFLSSTSLRAPPALG